MKTVFRLTFIAALCAALISGLWIATPRHTAAQGSIWTVAVFNNRDLAGTPIWTGTTPFVNYTWGTGAPVINGVATGAPADNFSIRFETTTFLTAGSYRFTATYDDGVRLYVDGILLINDWVEGSQRTRQADLTFAGDANHVIRVEYFDATFDALILVSWAVSTGPTITPPFGSGTAWVGQFFNNIDLAGAPVYSATYPPSGLNLDWGQGSPGGVVPVDNFSARFTRTITVPTDLPKGVYKFYARADDNFRFWVDQTLVFDYWTVFEDGRTYTADITLLNGPHDLKFEYRELSVNAYVFLTWDPPLAQNPPISPGIIPGATPVPGATVVPGATAVPAVTATVTANVLNFRAEPSLSAQIIAKLNRGAVYPVVGRTGDNVWAQIVVNGVTGWVMTQFVSFTGDINVIPVVGGGPAATPVPPPGPVQARGVTAGNLFIRQGPSSRTPQIGVIPWKATTDVLGRDVTHTWYQVSYGGIVGWSYAPWIRLTEGDFELLPYTDGSRPVFAPPATEGVVVQAFANMRIRSGPGLNFPKISQAHWGNRVQVLARSTNRQWYKILYGDVVGWTFTGGWKLIQGDLNSVPISDQ